MDVELHQGSVLSPFLFIMVMYVLTEKMKKEVPESITKNQEKGLELNEMRMLRWMCGATKKDKSETCKMIGKSSTSDQEDQREKARVIRTC